MLRASSKRSWSGDSPRIGRLFVLGLVCSLWFGAVIYRLGHLQLIESPELRARAQKQQESSIEIAAKRGSILDRNGAEFALSNPVDSIGVFPDKITSPALTASIVAEILDMDPREVATKLRGKGFQWVKRFAEPGQSERLRSLNLKGFHFEKESKRYYPKASVAAHTVGFVGVDHDGLAGLELQYDSILAGKPGRRHVQYDALRRRYESEVIEAPQEGASIELTIDERIQAVAETQLAAAVETTQARTASIVVMDPANGDLLALANWPPYDPNDSPRSPEELETRRNLAVESIYEPGSTFKIVTAAAALDQGLTTPEEIIDCQGGSIFIGGRRIRDHKKYDHLTMAEVVSNSSNVGVIKLGQRLGPERLHDYVTRFGFGKPTGLELPAEVGGILRPLKKWKSGSAPSISMGHEVAVTSLQMARAFAVIANGGYLVKPRIVSKIRQPSGEVRELRVEEPERVIRAETAATMRAILERTVADGTGVQAQTPGYRVGGKTGTAQMIDPETGAYSHTQYVASFGGFAPVNDPSIVSLIVLEAPVGRYYGGLVAAPVFPELASSALRFRDVQPTMPIDPKPVVAQGPRVADLADLPDLAAFGKVNRSSVSDAFLVSGLGNSTVGPLRPLESASPVRLRVTGIKTPNFLGLTVRQALAASSAAGVELDARGAGVGVQQYPAPGDAVLPGGTVRVEFRSVLAAASAVQ